MRLVALCDSPSAAVRLWRGLGDLPGIDLRFLVFGRSLPAQVRATPPADWKAALRLLLTRRLSITRRGLDHRSTLARLRALRPEIGLHASGTIVRQPVIACFPRGILNAHIGLLPEFRGRAAMEWSILEGRPTGVTVLFLDAGIDTGREIVLRVEIPVGAAPDAAAAQHRLFERDAEFLRAAIERLRSPGYRPETNDGSGRRFYAMSRLFTGVVGESLRRLSRGSGACT